MFKVINKIIVAGLLFGLVVPSISLSATAVATKASVEKSVSLPLHAGYIHNGVATCAGSMCHGAVNENKKTNIQHNEYITWERRDVHSRAYNKLFDKEFVAITNKLGLKKPSEEPVCLACHASDVPQKLRGTKFQMSDGIGCESCHGGSEKWLQNHTNKQATHAENIASGLYPADDIVDRARLCLSCHYGNQQKFVTHEIMGAGHPRISFELDTFTELQPKHFTQDDDYAKRKKSYSHVKAWAIGQAVTTESVLAMTLSNKFHPGGMFPELSLFDCHSCHHPMSDKRWQPKKGTGLKPGTVPFNDASLLMLRHVIAQVNKAEGWRFKKKVLALHAASVESFENFNQQAAEMAGEMPAIIKQIVKHEFTAKDIQEITASILNEGIWGGYSDYIEAEQCAMALSVLTISWDEKIPFEKNMREQIKTEIDRMFQLVDDDEAYDQKAFRASLLALREKLI